jgi:hypothetical protein
VATSDERCLVWWASTDVVPGHSHYRFQFDDVFTRETLAVGSYFCSLKDPNDIGKGCQESFGGFCEFRHVSMDCATAQQRVRAEWPDLYEVFDGSENCIR